MALSAPRSSGKRVVPHQHLLAFAIFSFLIGGLYLPVLLGHASLLTNGPWPPGPLFVGDPAAGGPGITPLQHLVAISWTHHALPVFDPYQAYGIPLLANQGEAVFPPELLAHLLFPGNYSIWNVANLVALGFGSYLLADAFGQTFLASLAVGVAAALAGVAPPNINMGMLNPLAVLPFVLVSLRYVLDPKSAHHQAGCLGLATSLALLSLSGFAEVLPLLAAVIIVYTAALLVHFKTTTLAPRRIISGILSGVIGVGIGGVGTFPVVAAINQGFGGNLPTSYLDRSPAFWLSTLTIPSITGKVMAGSPRDLGQTVWTLGTPVLVMVLLLALSISVHRAGGLVRWYVWPSAILVIFGILAYADIFNTLNIFAIFPFDSIVMVRLLQFSWWIPWCLLLGVVISNCHLLRWFEVLAALGIAILFDGAFLLKFQDALVAAHLSRVRSSTWTAFFVAVGILCAFGIAALFARRFSFSPFLMLAILAASTIYYLPTNFFPASGGEAVASVRFPRNHPVRGDYLDYSVGTVQLATTGYSVQLFGALASSSYQKVMPSLLPPADMVNDVSTVFEAGPWMYFAILNLHFVQILRELGTNVITSPTPLPGAAFGSIPQCGIATSVGTANGICFMGYGMNHGGATHEMLYVYSILDADPLVEPVRSVASVASNGSGISDTLHAISAEGGNLPEKAYVTMTGATSPTPARGVVGLARSATTQTVTVSLRSRAGGLVVLRESYETGMHAVVNGTVEPIYPVDGGLWSAVRISSGRSKIVLDYATRADVVEFFVAGIGLACLLLAWCALGTAWLRRRAIGRQASDHPDRSPQA